MNKPGPESTLGDVRAQLVKAATDDLVTQGVEIGLSHIKLSSAIRAAGVTRSTAYRSLANADDLSPQEALHREVLTAMLTRDARDSNLQNVQDAMTIELERQAENLASDDITKRTYAFRSLIRVGGAASYHAVIGSKERAILTAAYGSLLSAPSDGWRAQALKQGEDRITHLFGELFEATAALTQHQLRPGFRIEQFSTAAAAAVEGSAIRHGLNPHLDDIMLPTGSDGSEEVWTLFSLLIEGMFLRFFEPIDPDNPFIDLVNC